MFGKKFTFLIFILLFFPIYNSFSNNLQFYNAILNVPNSSLHSRMVQFDVSWENSWRTSSAPYNWDAVWVFVKYRVSGGEWQHATLSTSSSDHVAPIGSTISPPADGKGVFIYRSANGSGAFSLSGIQLKWNYGSDGISDGVDVDVKVFGVEMVYIPEGSFYAGDNGSSNACFKAGLNDNNPWYITSENTLNITNSSSGGYYYISANSTGEDAAGSTFTIPASFPKGFRAIYCMKYEITQGQYTAFLNMLNSTQAANRYDTNYYNLFRFTILKNGGAYSTTRPDRACNYLSWADGCAYADWSGLRPMTELEYEKICRGSGQKAVSGEYAWGTIIVTAAKTIVGTENGTEYISDNGSNCYYGAQIFSGGDGGQGPLRVGIFAKANSTREQSGATYYGVMEMSGDLWKRCVTVGNSAGRSFTALNGNGKLTSDGSADVSNWPGNDALGTGFRGGSWGELESFSVVSCRTFAAYPNNTRANNYGFRLVVFAP